MAESCAAPPWPGDGCRGWPGPAAPPRPPRSMLAGVKEDLYHPRLPTIRHMDMAASKLPDGHARTSTLCTREDFDRASFALPGPPCPRPPGLGLPERGPLLAVRDGVGSVAPGAPGRKGEEWPSYTQAVDDWSRFVSPSAEFGLPGAGPRCSRYADQSRCLWQDAGLRGYGQKPLLKSSL
ncbi:sperm microtubule inner protein 8 [Apteryx mantelli]|uniref:Sperm microtubule inner protein 8 n=1 Tax=Apteryx mantelli TaxID=2696672 RepID=A0ABM4F1W4_9AVES